MIEAAQTWQAAGSAEEGVKLVERLLAEPNLEAAFRLAALKQGAAIARAAQDFTRAGRWDAEHERLSAPPPAPAGSGRGAASARSAGAGR